MGHTAHVARLQARLESLSSNTRIAEMLQPPSTRREVGACITTWGHSTATPVGLTALCAADGRLARRLGAAAGAVPLK